MPVEFPVPPTEHQKELEAEVAKAFCARLYNNVVYSRNVYTGARGEKRGKGSLRAKRK